ncbi:MAG: NADP-dependent glyceraldehyde-3-phosphate dehydrogenase [Bacillota bacterium]
MGIEVDSKTMFKSLTDNVWGYSASNEFVQVYSPENGDVVGVVSAMTEKEVDDSIRLAKQAQKSWAETAVNKRAELLHRWADELLEMKDDIAEMIAKEVGKTISSSKSEVERTADLIRYTAEEGIRIHGEFIKGDSFTGGTKDKIALVEKSPLGVVLAISPFNYPVNLAASKIAPALIAGNTVVFKPATQGAISGLLMIEALMKAKLPASVVNVVTGKGSEIGDYIVTHPLIDMISFTGGTGTGQAISKKSSMIPVVLELGGKDPAIVLNDADLEQAASQIVGGALSYSGQRCTAIKRVLVIDEVADLLVEKLKEKIGKLTVGMASEGADIVPLIDTKSAQFVEKLVDDAKETGASIITGGERQGNLYYPTLIDHVTADMDIAWEEQFGPAVPVIRVKSVKEAIDLANQSEFGLQASLFTKNLEKAYTIASKLEVGTVQLNGKPERGPDHFPFLGTKKSGLGVQGVRRSIESMVRDKVTVINF